MSRKTRPNPDKLPDHHFIAGLKAAQERYKGVLPPFCEDNEGSTKAGLRKKALLRVTDDQQQETLPVEAEVIYWSWGPYHTFGTIDVGGQRLVVKGDSIANYPSYRSWDPDGFSEYAIAFGLFEKSERHNVDSKAQHTNHVQESSSSPYFDPSTKPCSSTPQAPTTYQANTRSQRPPSKGSPTDFTSVNSAHRAYITEYDTCHQDGRLQQQNIHTESPGQMASPTTQDSQRAIRGESRISNVSHTPTPYDDYFYAEADIDKVPSSRPTHHIPPPQRREHCPNAPYEPAQPPPPTYFSKDFSEAQENQDLTSIPKEDNTTAHRRPDHTPTEHTHVGVTSTHLHGKTADAPITPRPQHQGKTFTKPKSLSKPRKRKRQASISKPLDILSPQPSTATRSQSILSSVQPAPSIFSQNHSRPSTPTTSLRSNSYSQSTEPPLPSSSPPVLLVPDKQSRTTLFIALPLSTDSVPLKLRSCMSLDSFFTSILKISKLSEGDVVSGIRATFDWKKDRDVDRTILSKKDLEDSWEVFLEIVDAAPCWERDRERGRCGVGVEVVLV